MDCDILLPKRNYEPLINPEIQGINTFSNILLIDNN